MTKTELIKKVSLKTGFTLKDAKKAVDALTEVVSESIARDEDVTVPGFVSFKVKKLPAKDGIVPGTDRTYHTDERKTVKVYASKNLKAVVNA